MTRALITAAAIEQALIESVTTERLRLAQRDLLNEIGLVLLNCQTPEHAHAIGVLMRDLCERSARLESLAQTREEQMQDLARLTAVNRQPA